jgi:hypothetical protein
MSGMMSHKVETVRHRPRKCRARLNNLSHALSFGIFRNELRKMNFPEELSMLTCSEFNSLFPFRLERVRIGFYGWQLFCPK